MKKSTIYITVIVSLFLIIGYFIKLNSSSNNIETDNIDTEKSQYKVYYFSGENEQLVLNKGKIVIDGVKSSIHYEDLVFKGNDDSLIVFLNEKIISNNEKTLISSSYENKTGGIELSKIMNQRHSKSLKGDGLIEPEDLKSLLYKLTYTDIEGNTTEILLELKVKQIK